MKTLFALAVLAVAVSGCQNGDAQGTASASEPSSAQTAAAAPTTPRPLDATNIVSIAVGSKDHTTLVAALKAADYVDSISNPGPFTVFAPNNAAFDKLPKGTLESLTKPEKKEDLRAILKYHVSVSTYAIKDLHDGQVLSMANGAKATIHVQDGKVTINGAQILASIPASNGIVHVIDTVLLPPAS